MTPEELADAMKEVEQKEETEAAYRKEQVQELSRAAAAPQEVYEWLEQLDMPATVNRVLAAADYMNNRNQVFNRLFKMQTGAKICQRNWKISKKKYFLILQRQLRHRRKWQRPSGSWRIPQRMS